MTRAILLDYDGTLVSFDREAAFRAALDALGVKAGALAPRLAAEDRRRAGRGDHARAALFASHFPDVDPEHAKAAFWHGVMASTRPNPGARTLIDHCRGHGLGLGLLTDWDGAPGLKARRLAADDLVRAFDAVVIAGETVLERKPDPAPFINLCTRLGVAARDAVMVGDKVEIDLEPARALGMTAIWFRGEYTGVWSPAITDLEEVIALL
jgi:HAD superfamily hydrolase (TIGR01509 family)